MALRVWLPLNGNLENQGLSNVNITNNGATIDNNGKIGKCYSFGSSKRIAVSQPDNLSKSSASLSCWVNLSSWGSSYDSLINLSTGTGWNDTRLALVRNNTANRIGFCIANGSTYNYVVMTSDLPLNTWTHLAGTFDGSTIKIYVNGILNNSLSATFSSLVYGSAVLNLGSWSNGNNYPINGKLNDVRLYDHCLSPKEVKEISKGLVLHYKLTGHGSPNLLISTGPNDSGWGINQSGGVFTKTITSDCTTFNVTTRATSWFLYYHTLPTSVRNSLKVNTIYTYSFEAKSTANFNLGISLLSGNGTNPMSNSRGISILGDDQWHKYSVQLTTIADFSTLTQSDQYFYMSGGNVISTTSFRNAKLEEGSVMTTWCPHTSDALYTALGYNQSIEEDLSGYGYNGSISGTYSFSTDSPRYLTCADFSKSGHIINSSFNVNGKANTISMWVKQKTATTQHFLFGTFTSWTGNGIGFYRDANQAGYNCIFKSTSESSYGSLGTGIIALNTWTHIAFTYNGSTIICYINGVEKSRKTYGSNGDITNLVFMIANSKFNNTPASENEECYISDVRFYATALSAADILELYEVGGVIDSHYNSYTYEYITDDSNEYLNSQGISGISDLEETDENIKWLSTGKIESNNFYEI